MLDAKHESSHNAGHEQAALRQARPNPFDALRRVVDEFDGPRRGCFVKHRGEAAG